MLKGFINAKVRWPDQHREFSNELLIFAFDPQFEASFQWHGDIGCWFSVAQDSWKNLAEHRLIDALYQMADFGIQKLTIDQVSSVLEFYGFEDCTRFSDIQDTSKARVYVHTTSGDRVDHFDNAEAAQKFYKQTAKRGVKCAFRDAGDATPVDDWRENTPPQA